MKKRTFDGTGREVSEVGPGGWQIGGRELFVAKKA